MVTLSQQFEAQLEDLEKKGRGIYFFHDGSTELPVRDISEQGKKEPYIEYGWERGLNGESVIAAENHCYDCYQPAIRKLAESSEQYLFLLSNPTHLDMERCIVGYIRKNGCNVHDGERVSVFGETRLYSFKDAIPVSEYGKRTIAPLGGYGEVFDREETEDILNHFASCEEVTEEVLQKVLEMEDYEGANRSQTGC